MKDIMQAVFPSYQWKDRLDPHNYTEWASLLPIGGTIGKVPRLSQRICIMYLQRRRIIMNIYVTEKS